MEILRRHYLPSALFITVACAVTIEGYVTHHKTFLVSQPVAEEIPTITVQPPEIEYFHKTHKITTKNVSYVLKENKLVWAEKYLKKLGLKPAAGDYLFLSLKKEQGETKVCEARYYREHKDVYFSIVPDKQLVTKRATQNTTRRISDVISKSFYHSLMHYNLSKTVFNDCLKGLGHCMNLRTGLKDGMKLEILYSAIELPNGELIGAQLQYVSLKDKKKTHHQIYCFAPQGIRNFYNAQGEPIDRAALNLPLRGRNYKVSSKFGVRYHPIHKIHRMHAGVDYNAPRGTPVYAAASGFVTKACYVGGYGKMVEVQHSPNMRTRYAHLQKISVIPGEVIDRHKSLGAVGSTGTATGSHLHYEVLKNGARVNPQHLVYVEHQKLCGKMLGKFTQIKNDVQFQIASLDPEKVVSRIG